MLNNEDVIIESLKTCPLDIYAGVAQFNWITAIVHLYCRYIGTSLSSET